MKAALLFPVSLSLALVLSFSSIKSDKWKEKKGIIFLRSGERKRLIISRIDDDIVQSRVSTERKSIPFGSV